MLSNNLHIFRLMAALILLLHGAVAFAASITFNFSGNLTSSFGILNSGDAFSGSYSYDPAIPARAGSSASFSAFDNLQQASLTIGSFSAAVGPGAGLAELQQDDVAGADRYALLARGAAGSSQIGGYNADVFGFRLDDASGAAITDARNLISNPSLSIFASNSFYLFLKDPSSGNLQIIDGRLSSLSPAPVPAPAAFWLMGSALISIAGFKRRQKWSS